MAQSYPIAQSPARSQLPLRRPDVAMIVSWLVLLGATVSLPYLLQSPTLGDDLTRYTVRLALLYYAVAATLMLLLHRDEWLAGTGRGRLARWCWTLAWSSYLVHLAMAFHHYHHWSHADAVEHTRAVAGVGEGIYCSHLFTLLWTADVAWWWLWPRRYAARSPWTDRVLHAFMAFIIFNGMVVYEAGLIRWCGVTLFAGLAVVGGYRLVRR
jgi:hypothetical protein